ncbi:MAG: hypothetical protein RL266_1839 [Bacteroidota bacterium]|jgi:glycosyltransferase involved in cell wall biosynthesis
MPVRNAEPFLSECLESILNQTETNWELLAVDDDSTDSSHVTLQHYANEDVRIKVFQNDGSGIIDALRLAYSVSIGNLITRMDADDRMAPSKLEILKYNLICSSKESIAIGAVKYFSETPLGDGYKRYEEWLNSLTEKGSNYSEIYKECVIPSPCWMVFREDLESCGGFLPNTYPEDYDLCFRFYQHRLKPIPCKEVLHWWRDHPSRSSRNDANYADNRFLELKVKWFLELDRNPSKPLVVWGAGDKGKNVAKLLSEMDVSFHWVCNNPKKIGHTIYGVKMESASAHMNTDAQIIVTVANPEEQQEIRYQISETAYFFC